eukprot:TRINITY_DN19222_c0_g2_i1.p1 TRINITY_DN19222_c0_g2~~TRINITY_DN19222_c0_g2_i1.p1  ORF type:complete len:446 (+),score=35.33 TRINITY_DN19222_c0_g2_i1:70-1407(+)
MKLSHSRAWRQIVAGPGQMSASQLKLRVLQYNILADCLADGSENGVAPIECCAQFRVRGSAGVHYYQEPLDSCHVFRTAQSNLLWERRMPMLLDEIRLYSPDIICLQEVDHFDEIKASLQSSGYSGEFYKKRGRNIQDGCAIFWRDSHFSLAEKKGVHLGVNVMTALMVRLMSTSNFPVVVCATHLKAGFSVEMEDMRAKQTAELVRQVRMFSGSDATILGADLNAHHVAYNRYPAGQSCDPVERVEASVVPLLEKNGYRNAYDVYPSFTTWGGWLDRDVKATLDYILLKGPIVAQAALDVPDDEIVADLADRLPNDECPSDHLCLVADVVIEVDLERPDEDKQCVRSWTSRTWSKGNRKGKGPKGYRESDASHSLVTDSVYNGDVYEDKRYMSGDSRSYYGPQIISACETKGKSKGNSKGKKAGKSTLKGKSGLQGNQDECKQV